MLQIGPRLPHYAAPYRAASLHHPSPQGSRGQRHDGTTVAPSIPPSLSWIALMDAGFWKAGHRPTLFAAFFYFDLSFMVWVMPGPLGVAIASDLGLTPAQKGLMVATPVLAGALLRVPVGILVHHPKPRLPGLPGQ